MSDIRMDDVNIEANVDLHRADVRRRNQKNGLYQKIMDICCRCIQHHSDRRERQCVFQMPRFVTGYPLYDMDTAIPFVIRRLRHSDYIASYVYPDCVYINWDGKSALCEDGRGRSTPNEVNKSNNDGNGTVEVKSLEDTVKRIQLLCKNKGRANK